MPPTKGMIERKAKATMGNMNVNQMKMTRDPMKRAMTMSMLMTSHGTKYHLKITKI